MRKHDRRTKEGKLFLATLILSRLQDKIKATMDSVDSEIERAKCLIEKRRNG